MNVPQQPEDPIRDLASRMEKQWESARATTIGGAGVSTALVLLIAQIKPSDCLLQAAFVLAACAIPIWLALWQVGQSYSIYGKDRIEHFIRRGALIGSFLFFLAGTTTFGSLFSLILHFSCLAAIRFSVLSVLMAAFVFTHHTSVRDDRGGA